MYQFGFELEGFYTTKDVVSVPPATYPTDGFPGLVELRTTGAKNLKEAYLELTGLFWEVEHSVDFSRFEHTFRRDELTKIRSRQNIKNAINISNIYGKSPRHLGNKTIASFQINISYQQTSGYYNKEGFYVKPTYKLFDFVPIIRALDEEFKGEITEANRQPGFYAIKDNCRVEYRSLPNFVFETNKPKELMERIKKTLSGE